MLIFNIFYSNNNYYLGANLGGNLGDSLGDSLAGSLCRGGFEHRLYSFLLLARLHLERLVLVSFEPVLVRARFAWFQ